MSNELTDGPKETPIVQHPAQPLFPCLKTAAEWKAARIRNRGLGDMVKASLSAAGITEERVSKAIGKPCGCGKRAEKLNELGHKYLGLPPGESSAAS